jgi:lysophospholipase L1-like esterase
MKSMRLRRFVLVAVIAALSCAGSGWAQKAEKEASSQGAVTQSTAGQTAKQGTVAAQGPAVVTAPGWQKGEYWSKFDEKLLVDYADLGHFRDEDAKLGRPAAGEERVVFMGDSITQGWKLEVSFPGKPYVNRGISGQSSSQMLLRFRQDVIDLEPRVVLILAGTNDLAENSGPVTLEQVEGNVMSMSDLAKANGIRVVLCSVLPSVRFWWHEGLANPAERIAALNQWMKGYAAEKAYVYVDYYSAMKDADGGLPSKLSKDGVHPLPEGYAAMAPLAEAGIASALKKEGKAGRKN